MRNKTKQKYSIMKELDKGKIYEKTDKESR